MSNLPDIRSLVLRARRWECRHIPSSVTFFISISLADQSDAYFYKYEARNVDVMHGDLKEMLTAWSKSAFRTAPFTGEYRTAFVFIGKADLPTVQIYLSSDLKHVRLVAGGGTQEGVLTGAFVDWTRRFVQRRLSP